MMGDADRLWREACNLDDQGRLQDAILVYELAVAAGSTDAMVNLAMIYEHRTSPPKLQEAIVLDERAAAGGNPVGAWNLHRNYEMQGRETESHRWLKVAADLGDEDAVALLSKGH